LLESENCGLVFAEGRHFAEPHQVTTTDEVFVTLFADQPAMFRPVDATMEEVVEFRTRGGNAVRRQNGRRTAAWALSLERRQRDAWWPG